RQEARAPADLDDDVVRHLAPHHLDELRAPAAEARMRYGAAARRGRSGLDRARRVAAGRPRAVLRTAPAVGDDERQQDEAGCGDRGDGYGLWGSDGGDPLAFGRGEVAFRGRVMGSAPPVPA